jgi:hypothetical protein
MGLADAPMQVALQAGGSMRGEHGIGTGKLYGMC